MGRIDNIFLLRLVAPAFLELAASYTADEATIGAQSAFGREPFYTNLHIELKDLTNVLRTLDRSVKVDENGRDVLRKVLDVLESRFVRVEVADAAAGRAPKALAEEYPYKNLEYLREYINDCQNQDEVLDIAHLRRVICLADGQQKNRNHMISRISRCRQVLLDLVPAQPQVKLESYSPDSDTTSISRPLHKMREYTDLLHRLLFAGHLRCCKPPHTASKLGLSSYADNFTGPISFGIMFQPTSSAFKWKEGEIILNHPYRTPAGKKSVHFAKENTGAILELYKQRLTPELDNSTSEQRKLVDCVCKIVDKASHRLVKLRLQVDDERLWQLKSEDGEDIDPYDMVSLNELISPERPSLDRHAMAVVLANALLPLYEGPWLMRNWNNSHIWFRKIKRQVGQAVVDVTRPYVSAHCKTSHDDDEWDPDQLHPYPSIVALGVLLLEVVEGRPVGIHKSDEYDSDRYRVKALEMLKKCERNPLGPYVEAIRACLSADTFQPGLKFDKDEFRQQIYTTIVMPMENALKAGYRLSIEQLRGPSLLADLALPAGNGHRHQSTMVSHVRSTQMTRVKALPENNKTESWFTDLQNRVHCLIAQTRKDAVAAVGCGTALRVVKIAILDTGLDFPETAIWALQEDCPIKEYKDFVNSSREGIILFRDVIGGREKTIDKDGHGTAITGLLIKVSPNVEVYVARVFEMREDLDKKDIAAVVHQRISDAIKYACESWCVDIITMSFGFEESIPEIAHAIGNAYKRNVLMFAAASNKGANSPVLWPAAAHEVICIHASDHFGNASSFNPSRKHKSDNFSAPGQDLMCYVPEHCGDGRDEVPKSGTSFATPIAAGIAALVMEYADLCKTAEQKQLLCLMNKIEERLRNLKKPAGMSAVFRLMVNTHDREYSYLCPWNFIKEANVLSSTRTCNLEAILEALKNV